MGGPAFSVACPSEAAVAEGPAGGVADGAATTVGTGVGSGLATAGGSGVEDGANVAGGVGVADMLTTAEGDRAAALWVEVPLGLLGAPQPVSSAARAMLAAGISLLKVAMDAG